LFQRWNWKLLKNKGGNEKEKERERKKEKNTRQQRAAWKMPIISPRVDGSAPESTMDVL